MFACCFSLGFPKVWPWTSVWLTSAPDRFQTAAASLESPQRPWPDLTLIFDQSCIRYHELLCRGISDTRDYWISAFTKCLILNFLLDLYHYSWYKSFLLDLYHSSEMFLFKLSSEDLLCFFFLCEMLKTTS